MMHQSIFSYNITRPYPFQWFTWAVVVGGVVSVALVSFLNVAATGYELYAISTSDRNATTAEQTWISKWPSFLVSTRASCDSTEIPLQSRLYTNNTALPYTLYSVWNFDENQEKRIQGSLVYSNQPLQECHIEQIQIDIDVLGRSGSQIALIAVGATLTSTIDCFIEDLQTPNFRTHFQLSTSYDPVRAPSDPSENFLAVNKTSQESLYWGSSIMRIYWAKLMMEYYNSNLDLEIPLYKGIVTIKRNSTREIATADEVMGLDFFSVSCFFNELNNTHIAHQFQFCDANHSNISSLSNGPLMPNIWSSVNILGKAFYFSILADLGRSNSSGPNMLADPSLLANLSQNLTKVNETLINFRWGLGDIMKTSFDLSQAAGANLTVSPAVLTSNYICQVPKLKSGGTLFVSILVADLVLLQSLWMIFKLIVDTFWIGKRKHLKSCEGCATRTHELTPLSGRESSLDEPLVPQRTNVE